MRDESREATELEHACHLALLPPVHQLHNHAQQAMGTHGHVTRAAAQPAHLQAARAAIRLTAAARAAIQTTHTHATQAIRATAQPSDVLQAQAAQPLHVPITRRAQSRRRPSPLVCARSACGCGLVVP
jgi:hypothetical protein